MAFIEIKDNDKAKLQIVTNHILNNNIDSLSDFKILSKTAYQIMISKNATIEKAITLVRLLPEKIVIWRDRKSELGRPIDKKYIDFISQIIDFSKKNFTDYYAVLKFLDITPQVKEAEPEGILVSDNQDATLKEIDNQNSTFNFLPKHNILYIWKEGASFSPFSTDGNWRGTYMDSWFIYSKTDEAITKTMCFTQYEVEDYVYKEYRSIKKSPYKIIQAAPQNLDLFKFDDLEYNKSTIMPGLNFDDLMKKYVLYVRSVQYDNMGESENLYIDISYKKILDSYDFKKFNNNISRRESLLSAIRKAKNNDASKEETPPIDIRKIKLLEYQQKFPDMKFDSEVIPYFTYNINPACNRTFEELYDDYDDITFQNAYHNFDGF
jgi:hypothetical protein